MALISNIKLPDGSKHGIRALGIPYAEVDSTSTSTAYTATIPGITELVDGTCILLKNGVVTSAANFTININGLGAKPSYNNMATGNDVTPTAPTRDTTIFNINYTMLFIYSSTLVDGGAWICYRGYDANTNTLGYQLRTNSYILNASDGFRYYVILFTSADGTKWVPANSNKSNSATTAKTVNQTPINPFGEIVYCGNSTNYSAGSAVTATAIWQEYTVTLGYSFNKTGAALTLTTKKPVYIKCTPQTDGSAIIDSTTPYVQDLPTTDDGKIYILLGMAYSATAIELLMNHPVYYYKDGAIRLWTNAAEIEPLVIEVDADNGDGEEVYSGVYNDIISAVSNKRNVFLKVSYSSGLVVYAPLIRYNSHTCDFSVCYSNLTYTYYIDNSDLFINDGNETSVVTSNMNQNIAGTKTFTGTVNLGSNATATTPAAGDNDTSVATTAFVQNAVNSLPTPMQFKGSLGTGGTYTSSTIPAAAASNKGWTLKVITDGTYRGVAAKAGDTLISNCNNWILIPSGDEPSGTVTSVGLSMPTGFTVSNSPITSSGTLSVSMASGYTIPTNSQVNCWNCKIGESFIRLPGNYTSNPIFSGNSTPIANYDYFETAIAKLDKIVQDDELVSAAAFTNLNVRLNCHSAKILDMGASIINACGMATNAYSIANDAMTHACNLGSQLSRYAQLCSPNFSGTPTAPTPAIGTNNTLIATAAFVNTAILCSLSALCDFATKNYICSCLIPQIGHGFEEIDERFDDNSLVVSAALNDLNDRITTLSDEISNIDTSELQDLIDQLDAVVGAGLNDLNDNKLDRLNWDTTPTANSYNPVYSGGIKTELNKKQATLVSGTNIKTVNGCSLLGSGNITIQGGGGTVTSVGLSMPTGFTVSSTPITTNGTISVTMTSGYAIPTTTQVTCWNNKVSNILSDWNATSGSAVILNKPTVISSIGYNSPGGYLTANSSNAVQLTVCSSNGRKLNIGGSTWQFTSTTEPSASADKSLIAPTWSAMTSAVSGKADAVSATAGTYRSVTVNSQGLVTAGTNPTTLSGYGITDAKIASGTITLGSNTITPLTSHQTLKTINSTAITGSGNISIPVVANLNASSSLPTGANGTGVTISSTNYYMVSDKPYCTSSDTNVAPSWSAIQSCLSAVRTEMASSGGVTIYSGSSIPSSSLGSNGDIYIQTT